MQSALELWKRLFHCVFVPRLYGYPVRRMLPPSPRVSLCGVRRGAEGKEVSKIGTGGARLMQQRHCTCVWNGGAIPERGFSANRQN